MLAAVLSGNLLYFAVLMPVLPAWLRHRPYHLDAGLVLDFVLCVAILALLGRLVPEPRPGGPGNQPPSDAGPSPDR